MRVLLVKMSSLGDVVHALPAVSDAAAHGVRFDWVVEEAFTHIAEQHPAVGKVLPIGWRRWRGNLLAHRGSLGHFLRELRKEPYDLVLDAQGLIKSAVVTACSRAERKAGFDRRSAREGVAAMAYGERIPVSRAHHAVDRLRTLFAEIFGYSIQGPPDFGLSRTAPTGERRCLLLHGTTWPSKHWPVTMWRELGRQMTEEGWQVALPWGNAEEHERARAIGSGMTGIEILPRLSLAELNGVIVDSSLVIGVDSGLLHLAAAFGVPTLGLYGATDPTLTGCRGENAVTLAAEFDCAPCLSRRCAYQGQPLSWRDEPIEPACYARLTPDRVREQAMKVLEDSRKKSGEHSG